MRAKQHGCKIVAWYQDDGITGDSIEKRPQFSRMLADAERGAFEVILCWDQDRFGRFDSITAGAVVHPLRQAGVRLVTIAQGVIDWNDFAGRMMYAIAQEGKHQFLRDLSRNVLRGQIRSAEQGNWQGMPPLGYDRQYFDERGNVAKVVPNGEKFKAPREWRCRLIVSADEEAVELVRWMFNEFALKEVGFSTVARDLNRRGTKTVSGALWSPTVVRKILTNPTYIGHTVFGRTSAGKYHHVGDGGEISAKNGAASSGCVTSENTHEALIDGAMFRLVQEKITARNGNRWAVVKSSYCLSQLLHCGHCGGKMCGHYHRGLDRRFYRCKGGDMGECRCYYIPAEKLEKFLFEVVHEQILAEDQLDRIRSEIVAKLKQRRPKRTQTAATIRAELAKVEKKIKKGTERLLLVDDDAAQDASLLLAEWREERASLSARLREDAQSGDVGGGTPEKQAEQAVAALLDLRRSMQDADPARLRHIFGKVFSEVRLCWAVRTPTSKSAGRRNRYRFSHGTARLRDNADDVTAVSHLHHRVASG